MCHTLSFAQQSNQFCPAAVNCQSCFSEDATQPSLCASPYIQQLDPTMIWIFFVLFVHPFPAEPAFQMSKGGLAKRNLVSASCHTPYGSITIIFLFMTYTDSYSSERKTKSKFFVIETHLQKKLPIPTYLSPTVRAGFKAVSTVHMMYNVGDIGLSQSLHVLYMCLVWW